MGRRGKSKQARSESAQGTFVAAADASPTLAEKSPSATGHGRGALIAGLLAMAAFAANARVLNHDFVYLDDRVYVTENEQVQKGLTREGIAWALTATHASNWHPLTWMSHMLDCELFGLNPSGHHLTSLLLHAINTALVFLVFRRMTRSTGCSAFVAGAFGLHPAHVESVAWVAERKDVLSTTFGLLATLAYARYAERRTIGRYVVVLVLLALGLAAKPMLVTLPCVFLLLDWWPLGRFRRADDRRGRFARIGWPAVEKVPLFALAAASSVVTLHAQRAGGAMMTQAMASLDVRVANAVVSYAKYLATAFWPTGLAVYYPHPLDMPSTGEIIVAAAALSGVTFAAVAFARRRPYLAAGWFWFVGTLVPVIGIVQVGGQARADRYTYIPYIGLFIMVAWGVGEFSRRATQAGASSIRWIVGAGATAALASLAAATWNQSGYWRDSERLFRRAIDVVPDNAYAHVFLAQTLVREGRLAEAAEQFGEAVRIVPNEPYNLADYGRALYESGRIDEAAAQLERAVKLLPTHAGAQYFLGVVRGAQRRPTEAIAHLEEALRLDPRLLRAHHFIGSAYADLGRPIQAIQHLQRWLEIDPRASDTLVRLGQCYSAMGNEQAAADAFQRAVEANPRDAHALAVLAQLLSWRGDIGGAIERYEQALRIAPDYVEVANNLAMIYATAGDDSMRNVARALELAEHACRITQRRDPVSLDTLATAQAEAGRFEQAAATLAIAVELARSSGANELATYLEQRKSSYESGPSPRSATPERSP